jgi:hypothetical protein
VAARIGRARRRSYWRSAPGTLSIHRSRLVVSLGQPLHDPVFQEAHVPAIRTYGTSPSSTMHGLDEFFGNLYHLNAEEEPELRD